LLDQADAERAQAAAAAAAAEQSRIKQQADYLEGLQLELVRVRDGEEAYTRLTLAKQGFTEATIDSAIAMKAELDALRNVSKGSPSSPTPGQQSLPGLVQATQQRFITRGNTGPNLEKAVADNTKQTAMTLAELRKLQLETAAMWRRHFQLVEQQLKDPA
jgi:hypothetical protein